MPLDDPFAAPVSQVADPSGAFGVVSPGVVEVLRRTKGWVRFLAVLGFVGAGLSLLMAVVFAALGLTGGGAFQETPAPVAISIGYAVVLGAAALVYVFPSLRLLRYAGAIARLEVGRDAAALQTALDQQRAFWRLVGLIAIATLVLYALGIAAAIGLGVMTAMRGAA